MNKAELKELVKNGWSTHRIAHELKLSQTNIRHWLKKYGLRTRFGSRGSLQDVSENYRAMCVGCGEVIKDKTRIGHRRRYCTLQCQMAKKRQKVQEKIATTGLATGVVSAKIFLRNRGDTACAVCGLSVWLGQPIMLILDHIDGNSDNWRIVNLRLICSNCDAQTPTYKNRNLGKGRHSRKQRYAAGKSY